MKKILLIPLLFLSLLLMGQDSGLLHGKVTDKETGEPLPFVAIIIEKGGVEITGGMSDFDGNFMIKSICADIYSLKASMVGFENLRMDSVSIGMKDSIHLSMELKSSNEIIYFSCCCCCRCFIMEPEPEPIIDLFVEADSIAHIMDSTLASFDISENRMMELTAFPNPSSGIFTLKNIKEPTEIMVMDMSGKTVKTMFAEKDEMVTINLSSHHPGTYILKYEEEGALKALRLIMH